VTWRTWTTFWILCALWGVPYFFIKLALLELSPAFVAWSRLTLAALVLVPIAWQRGVLKPALRHKGAIVAFAIAELVIPFSLISVGEQWISSSLAGVLIATVPMMVVFVAPAFGIRENIDARRLTGLGVGFFGVIVLLGVDTISTPEQWWGVACLFGAVAGYAVGPLIVQRHLAGVDELGSLSASLVVASIILAPAALFTAPERIPSPLVLTSAVVLGIFCTAIALLLFFYLIHEAGAARAAIVAYINPAVAAVLGVLVLNEHFGIGMAVGLALILIGSWLGTRGARQRTEVTGGRRTADGEGVVGG
jgi:drug/metabolite transporter (DMT)-like permease